MDQLANGAMRRIEKHIRGIRSPQECRAVLALDDDDVQSECRIQALFAIQKFFAANDPSDEDAPVRYARAAIRNQLLTLIRKARQKSRIACDEVAHGMLFTAFVDYDDMNPETAFIQRERQEFMRRAMDHLNTQFPMAKTLKARSDFSLKRTDQLAVRSAHARARRILGQFALNHMGDHKESYLMADLKELTVEDLIRVAVACSVDVDVPLELTELRNLIVKNVLTDPETGEVDELPPCFSEYDDKDPLCNESCGFTTECAAVHHGRVGTYPEDMQDVADTFEQIIQLKRAEPLGEDILPPIVEAFPVPKPDAVTEMYEDRQAESPPNDWQERFVKAEVVDKAASKSAKSRIVADAEIVVPAAKPRKKQRADDGYVTLSGRTRKPEGGYATRPNGKRYTRLPQGSAAELARLPVGTEVDRLWQGERFYARKIKDGPVSVRDGRKRQRDGEWELFKSVKIDDNGVEVTTPHNFVGSLNQVAKHITGANAWSGAKFFAVLPPQLDRNSGKFNPDKYAPNPVYNYDQGE